MNTTHLALVQQDFSRSLFGALVANDASANIVFSPLSIFVVFLMSLIGAREQTKDEMIKALRIKNSINYEDLHPSVSKMFEMLKSSQTLKIANNVFVDKKVKLREDFISMLDYYYGVEPQRCNFATEAPKCRKIINLWVEENTNGIIQDAISPGVLTSLTKLVLVNAIYFKGTWKNEFNPKFTSKLPFKAIGGNSQQDVKMMKKYSTHEQYGENDVAKWVRLSYQDDFNGIFILPKNSSDLSEEAMDNVQDFIKSTDNLLSKLPTLRTNLQKLFIPRFKIEFSTELTKIMQELGMKQAFRDEADFTGMAKSHQRLHISAVIHKAYIKVNEKGTEAAGFSAIHMVNRSLRIGDIKHEFVADRPFLFVIEHAPTQALVFLSRVNKV
jgi:serine protease inhibitor